MAAAGGKVIAQTDRAFRLMLAFVEHPRRGVTQDQLLGWSRGEESDPFDRAIDARFGRLRRKLAQGDGGDALICIIRKADYFGGQRPGFALTTCSIA